MTNDTHNQSTNSNYYAGIGSRQTPKHIQDLMHHIACYLYAEGWTLRSGAANGADTAFEIANTTMEITENKGSRKEIYLPWKGYNNSMSQLHPINYPFTQIEQEYTAYHHPAWDKCSPSAKLLHCRNTRIVLGMEALHGKQVMASKFIVCWTSQGLMTGGTAQALRIAKAYKIPVFNLGFATNPKELELQVLAIDEMQTRLKS